MIGFAIINPSKFQIERRQPKTEEETHIKVVSCWAGTNLPSPAILIVPSEFVAVVSDPQSIFSFIDIISSWVWVMILC